jgi:hypothetical protein
MTLIEFPARFPSMDCAFLQFFSELPMMLIAAVISIAEFS